jgi:acetoacetyl-CoA synthetase
METAGYWYKGKWQDIQERTEQIVANCPSANLIITCPQCNGPVPAGRKSVTFSFPQNRLSDILREEAASTSVDFERMSFQEPVCILFTSGTTGKPKAIVHGNGVFVNHLKEHRLHLNQTRDSVVLQYTSLSWMMFNHMVSSLASGCTLVLYEGAPALPDDPLRLLRIAKDERVTHLGLSPGLLTQLSKQGCHPTRELGSNAFNHLSVLMVTGAPSTLSNFAYVAETIGPHVAYISLSGGTDICGCFLLGCPGWIPVTPPRLTRAGLAMDVQCLSADGRRCHGPDGKGELCCLSVMPAYPLYFVDDPSHAKYRSSYFAKFGDSIWCHGDSIVEFDKADGGGFLILGRSDLVMNVHGIRLGSSDIYRVTERIPWVADACAVGQECAGDVRMVLVLELVAGQALSPERILEIKQAIRADLSPRHVPSVVLSASIPYTFSGKKCETAVKEVLDGKNVTSERALRNPEAVEQIRLAMKHSLA